MKRKTEKFSEQNLLKLQRCAYPIVNMPLEPLVMPICYIIILKKKRKRKPETETEKKNIMLNGISSAKTFVFLYHILICKREEESFCSSLRQNSCFICVINAYIYIQYYKLTHAHTRTRTHPSIGQHI